MVKKDIILERKYIPNGNIKKISDIPIYKIKYVIPRIDQYGYNYNYIYASIFFYKKYDNNPFRERMLVKKTFLKGFDLQGDKTYELW